MSEIFKECSQIHCMKVMMDVGTCILVVQQKKDALCEINLIKDKLRGKIKGFTCANMRP